MKLKNEKVLVTGSTGYIAQHCIKELLKRGYKVKGSLRNLRMEKEVSKLFYDEFLNQRIEFCKLDLLFDEGWNEALSDCDYLLHVASPCTIKEPKDEDSIIKPAIEGTLRALKAAQNAKVRKVVLTSSIGAMAFGNNKKICCVNDWTDIQQNVGAYIKSKTLSEKAAWDFVNNSPELYFKFTTINPGMVFGPFLSEGLKGASASLIKELISGNFPALPDIYFTFVDVRDVAKLHVDALEIDRSNSKRIIAASREGISFLQISEFLRSKGFKKSPKNLVPNLFIYFLGFFNGDMKRTSLLIKKGCYGSDISETNSIFNWEPISFEKTMNDMIGSLNKLNLPNR